MTAYYNEIDPYCAAWLRELIHANLIASGVVDERDIRDVAPADLRPYTQCHFFAGIGGWSRALRLVHWPDDRPVWTGSCPCQPFSTAGKGGGFDDIRHLWPDWHWLISRCRPRRIYGEQVASPDGLRWLDLVCADLEAEDYTGWVDDLCAAGTGAPHIRQRLWFVADAAKPGCDVLAQRAGGTNGWMPPESGRLCNAGELVHADTTRPQGYFVGWNGADQRLAGSPSLADQLEHAARHGWQQRRSEPGEWGVERGCGENFWNNAEWLACTDGKHRPVEPGTFPLAHGVPQRVAKLRALGNAIVPQVAAEFIRASMS